MKRGNKRADLSLLAFHFWELDVIVIFFIYIDYALIIFGVTAFRYYVSGIKSPVSNLNTAVSSF